MKLNLLIKLLLIILILLSSCAPHTMMCQKYLVTSVNPLHAIKVGKPYKNQLNVGDTLKIIIR